MAMSLAEQRIAQFYCWETRCRGWQCYDVPVDLEPTFEPFLFRPHSTLQIDDGVRPTIISSIADFITGKPKPKIVVNKPEGWDYEIAPIIFDSDAPLRTLQISLPNGRLVEAKEMEQLLCMLSYCRYPLSFEIIATSISISLQMICREPDSVHVQSQIKAYFPDSVIHVTNDSLREILDSDGYIYIADFGLTAEFMLPLAMPDRYSFDPYIGLFGCLENLQEGQQALVQVLFKGAVNSWSESIIHSITDYDGKCFFMDAPEMVNLAHEKISSPLYGVTVRVLSLAKTVPEAAQIIENVCSSVEHTSRSSSNALIPLVTEAYTFELRIQDVVNRQSHRQGMLLNSRELATLVHFPSDSVVSAKLKSVRRKTKALPESAKGHKLQLGYNIHQGKERVATLSDAQRLKHLHVIGATGTGKSTFLLNLITQDIENGEGLAVLDPHGDLIESILCQIPENRLNDVMIIDPSDAEFPLGFNILSGHSEIEKEILSSDLVAGFKRLSTSWGDQMNSVLANAILAFLESPKGGTLIDLRRFLIEKSFRDTFLRSVTDPSITYYWEKEYPLLKSSSIGSILTRLDTFLRPKLIRNMVAQKTSPNFERIMDSKKILLVKLSQGLIGTENSYLLGTLIVSKIQQAAMARQALDKTERTPFYLYIDEFQNFITPSMSAILSGARKYHLGLILAHQDMQQLVKYDSELATSITSNAGTRVCFRLGDTDAKRFEGSFLSFDSHDLQNLDTGEAIVRMERSENDFTISTTRHTEIEEETAELNKRRAVAKSQAKYGTARTRIEDILHEEYNKTQDKEIVKQDSNEEVKLVPDIPVEAKIPRKDRVTKPDTEHRYLQTLIKKMAELRGYKASIEEPIANGRVDVSLERKGKKIACEVCVTTIDTWEVHNIEKCISAGYHMVATISTVGKSLEKIRNLVEEKLSDKQRKKLLICDPATFFQFLDAEAAKDLSSEELIKGYRVKVDYSAIDPSISKQKRDNIMNIIGSSIKNQKK